MDYRILRVNLNKRKFKVEKLEQDLIEQYIGGRGFAAKIIWDEVKKGTDPFDPANKLVFATGPLTALPIPSSGKLVVASKSPLTLGYGDGNIGTKASVQLKQAGYDAVIFEGAAEDPIQVHIENDRIKFQDAGDLWGKDSFAKEEILMREVGSRAGALTLGQGGENLVRYATIMSQKGRAGGRTGMGAVMGSKKLAAVTFRGNKDLQIYDEEELKNLGKEAYKEIRRQDDYNFWLRQGTMQTLRWCNVNFSLPTRNFREGFFEEAEEVDGFSMERHKTGRRGCPNCNMQCGNLIRDTEGEEPELDYENVAMLGPNLGIGNIQKVGVLNRLCDLHGIDTISTGSSIAFAMEAAEKGIIDENLTFGDYKEAKKLVEEIAFRQGLGDQLAEGVKRTAKEWGDDSEDWAMQVKGLEISAYNCHALPGMALAYGTSPIGAHHKDCWVIAWEVENERAGYSNRKIKEILNHQRRKGGAFECFTVCRFPWIELGFDLDWYEKFFEAATGISMSWKEFDEVGDRIYSLIRSIFVREYGNDWNEQMDVPPERWFNEPPTIGDYKGESLDKEQYMDMLKRYYKKRGWNERGIPTKGNLKKLGLEFVIPELEKEINL